MLFNSLTFVAFFALVLTLHRLPFSWTVKKTNLMVASYLFYAAWNPPFVVLLWISTLVDWYVAKAIYRENVQAKRRALLVLSILTNLGILGFFKYGTFLLENFVALMAALGVDYHPAAPDIILPVGISFYTFQTMAYSLDVYLRRAAPAKSFLDFSLFVTFFPQLVAGPIVRPTHLIPQFEKERKATRAMMLWGFGLVTLGLFEKVVVADGLLSPSAEAVFGTKEAVTFLDAWLGTLAFSGQIFCDFAGYSTTAIGIGLCLGFSLPTNFRFPYAAIGFSDFWRRWHISLSTWLRDYLYIPLGGNRLGRIRTYVNLMLTMLIGGLWHGASWTFVVWGGLHGLYLSVERLLTEKVKAPAWVASEAGKLFLGLATYFFVNITWVFFRATDFGQAFAMIQSMFGFTAGGKAVLPTVHIVEVALTITALVAIQWKMRDSSVEALVARTPWPVVGLVWGLMLSALILTQGSGNAFIYFQF